MKVYVTKVGSEMPTNSWKEGQQIECHENIGNYFIEKGIATLDPIKKEIKPKKEIVK